MSFLYGIIMFFICHTLANIFTNNIYCYIQEEKSEEVNQYAMKQYLIKAIITFVIYIALLIITLSIDTFSQYKSAILIGNGIGFVTGAIHFMYIADENYKRKKAKNKLDSLNYISSEEERESIKNNQIKNQTKGFLEKGINYSISKFIKEEHLVGKLEDIEIVVGKYEVSFYSKKDNIIYICDKDNVSQDSFIIALTVCFQQAIYDEQGILYSSTPLGQQDTRENLEDLFDENDNDSSEDELKEEEFDEDEEDIEDNNIQFPSFNRVRDEKTFFESQQISSGFFPDYSFNKKQYIQLKNKKEKYGKLIPDEESKLIFPLIFGNFDTQIDLDLALTETNKLLEYVNSRKPTKNLVRENDLYMDWLHQFAIPQILLGTIYAYKKEYVKASYHFMLGLKTEQIAINMPYCDFIRYVLSQLSNLTITKSNRKGCGFEIDNPMGSCGGNSLIPLNAFKIIPEMEGKNGEVIIARMGNTGLFGNLKRLKSVYSPSYSVYIDVYETYIIDKNYNIKKIHLYFNGYFNFDSRNSIKLAKGFRLKSHSLLFNSVKIVEE